VHVRACNAGSVEKWNGSCSCPMRRRPYNSFLMIEESKENKKG